MKAFNIKSRSRKEQRRLRQTDREILQNAMQYRIAQGEDPRAEVLTPPATLIERIHRFLS